MILAFQIPDKLYYIQNFLDYETYKEMHRQVFRDKKINLETTQHEWQQGLLHGHKNFTKKTQFNSEQYFLKKIKTLLQDNPLHKIECNDFNFILHSMEDGAGINWHDDGSYEYGVTYYLNRRWNPKFGGELLFSDNRFSGFIPVKGNSLLILKTPVSHKVSAVTKSLVPRKTIQIFINK
jgi:Rps23 Pro-64 3,4-dihydroxylase Tpa1-like proline 4-hydroxylase